ncbi:helix-turn-helix domain-containing protein [Streptococcus ovuberis]|uniref:Helix-turn-helix domain-containing protein n=1 Tax=Streptococcus ovuberis TaxID=1936207 RepID=A0A7X6MZ93_9STRE|nr:helix-turn-helix domain-containing protein [Streptococcus ovuberis]NKZ20601.1 helix-turn-helix domain-containing protein [Streptococcus ovuberis]
MAEQTIGQVLRAAREEFNLTVSDVYSSLKIHRRYIRALERDHFDVIPGQNQARNLLARYAEFLELDLPTILEAYDNHEPLMVYQLPTNDPRYVRFSRKKRPKQSQSYLPFFYLLLSACLIIGLVGVTIWHYYQDPSEESKKETHTYQVSYQTNSSEASSEPSKIDQETNLSTDRSSAPKSLPLEIVLTPEQTLEIRQAPDKVEISLSVDQTESWVSLSDTELAEGKLLSPESPSVSVSVDRQIRPQVMLSIGSLEGLSLKINQQTVDLSSLPNQPTNLTLIFK